MAIRPKKALTALAAFLAFSCSQVYVLAGLPNSTTAGAPQRAITATLRTRNNQPITVNGNPGSTGMTILTGAILETSDQTAGTIDLGDAGVVDIEPNSKIELAFDANGNVRVKVLRGCVAARRTTNVLSGELELFTEEGASEKTDRNRRNVAGCYLAGGKLGAPGPAGLGLSTGAKWGIGLGITGGVITAYLLARGGDPSPAG